MTAPPLCSQIKICIIIIVKEDIEPSYDIVPVGDHQKIVELLHSNANEIIAQILRDMDDVVPTMISLQMVGDIVRCLNSGTSEFNKLWLVDGNVIGFLVCDEIQTSHGPELDLKYFGVKRFKDRKAPTDLITGNIEKIIKKAKKKGFERISLHGFNKALNWLLERRYGFKPEIARDLHTIAGGGDLIVVPYLYLDLTNSDNPIQSNGPIQLSDEQSKYNESLNLPELENSLAERGIDIAHPDYKVVKIKVHRYLKLANRDIPLGGWQSLADAIVENYTLLISTEMGIAATIEKHRQGTQQAIRKFREELVANPTSQPEFLTSYGKLRLFRLNNRQQLAQESVWMNHCVGKSDHYLNNIIEGRVEIWSVRDGTGKPLLTIEYQPISNQLSQMKKKNDELLTGQEPWFADFLGILKQLSGLNPQVNIRSFGDTNNIKIEHDEVITYNGEKKTIDELLDGEDKSVFVGKVVFNENTQKETLLALAKVTGLTLDCTSLKPEMKNLLIEVKGNLIDESRESSQYDKLTSVIGFFELWSTTRIILPQLRSVGGKFLIELATSIELPQLQSVGENLWLRSVKSIELPQLQSVGENLWLWSVTSIELPQLQSVGGYFSLDSATSINLPQLRSIGSFFNADPATTIYLPELQLINGTFIARSATSISLPKLQAINGRLYAPSSSKIIFPRIFIINGKTMRLSLFKFSRSIARIMGH